MQLRLNGKSIDAFSKSRLATRANRFPDFLLIAGGKVATAGDRVKYRVEVRDGNDRLKKWSETVEFTDPGDGPMGNLFEGGLVKKDDLSDQGLDISFQIAGQDAQFVDFIELGDGTAPVVGLYLTVSDGGANSGIVGLIMLQ
jgi:hypothetical protein